MHPGEGYASIDGRAWETLLFYAWSQRSSDCCTCLIRRASGLRRHAKQVFLSGCSPAEYDGVCSGAQQPDEVWGC